MPNDPLRPGVSADLQASNELLNVVALILDAQADLQLEMDRLRSDVARTLGRGPLNSNVGAGRVATALLTRMTRIAAQTQIDLAAIHARITPIDAAYYARHAAPYRKRKDAIKQEEK